jgi:acyl-coenzyme A synthetase/AMP-(fatty) acid ligase
MRFLYARITFDDGRVDSVLINPAHIRMVQWHHPHYARFNVRLFMIDGSTLTAEVFKEALEELGLPIREFD